MADVHPITPPNSGTIQAPELKANGHKTPAGGKTGRWESLEPGKTFAALGGHDYSLKIACTARPGTIPSNCHTHVKRWGRILTR